MIANDNRKFERICSIGYKTNMVSEWEYTAVKLLTKYKSPLSKETLAA